MWRKFGLKTIAVPLALFCMAIPVGTALILAEQQAVRTEKAYVLHYARDALRRSERSADQIDAAARALGRVPTSSLCADEGLRLMQRIDLRSTLLQGVGYAVGDDLVCSSFAGRKSLPLGKPDLVTRTGVVMRTHVRFDPRDPDYLVVTMGHIAAIVHKELAFSFLDGAPGLALSTFEWRSKRPLNQMGRFDPAWLSRPVESEVVFATKGYLVAIARSQQRDLATMAALPRSSAPRMWRAGMILLPIGVITGIVFAVLMIHIVRNRLSLPSLIQLGLRRNEFFLMFQPGVHLKTGRTVAAEVLLRWQRPDGEIIAPDVFVAAAEDAGMIRPLTVRMLELLGNLTDACKALPADFRFAINLAADDLHNPATVDALRQLLGRSEPPLTNLIVEATERSFVNAEQARSVIEQIRALGLQIAIDDFGTGYSSLSYLATLHVDLIKVDKLFVQALGTDSATAPVAGHIIRLARDLGLRTVAEGVETEAQAELLRQLGATYGQGWLFGRPMSLDELIARMKAERQAAAAPEPAVA